MSLDDGVVRVLFVHAHPDDETLATGALIIELVDRGVDVQLVTATRGERGDIVAEVFAHDPDPETLSAIREGELSHASNILGIGERYWLGAAPARAPGSVTRRYLDSGMEWVGPGLAGPSPFVTSDALVSAPLDEVTNDLIALIDAIRPSLVVSYDDAGGYGHPDHVRLHDATLAACRATHASFAEIVAAPGDGVEWFELAHRLPVVAAALGAHASQVRVDGTDVVHSGGQRHAIPASVGLRRA
ncbi:PIG-L deacetylase family protein [Agreia sp.]|uniref:PIG-L deacetylase family protein n=1 Tax=Agreia sp. TaxID=1872416 RepID=UPI0035BBF2EC